MLIPPLDIPDTNQIQIIPTGGHYVFRRVDVSGKEQAVDLTPDDILKLYQTIPQFARLAMQAAQPMLQDVPSIATEVWASVHQTVVMLDIHSTMVLFRVRDEFGLESRFSLDVVLARKTGQELEKKADDVAAASAGRIRQ